jgi:uncharacterized protein YwgA
MASTEKRLKDRELLLLTAAAADGKFNGRTVAQKLLYFCGRKLDQPTGHSAYFYGPYSDDFDSALKRGVLAEDFAEQIERIADWHGGQDAMKHVYTLTERGISEARRVAESRQNEAAVVNETVATIAASVPGFRQKTLSAAAKIDLIVSELEKPVPKNEIGRLAQELGWNLSESEVNEALDVLARLDLVSLTG